MIDVNGKKYNGNSVIVNNGHVFVDGKEVDVEKNEKIINISVVGPLDNLNADSCNSISIKGDVNRVKTMSGDVEIAGSVTGSVQTMSGDVTCQKIRGKTSNMSGDIN